MRYLQSEASNRATVARLERGSSSGGEGGGGRGGAPRETGEFGDLGKHLRWAERHTRHLGRGLFHAMVRFGPKLERRQMVLFRAGDIGADLFAMTAAGGRGQVLAGLNKRIAPEAQTVSFGDGPSFKEALAVLKEWESRCLKEKLRW